MPALIAALRDGSISIGQPFVLCSSEGEKISSSVVSSVLYEHCDMTIIGITDSTGAAFYFDDSCPAVESRPDPAKSETTTLVPVVDDRIIAYGYLGHFS